LPLTQQDENVPVSLQWTNWVTRCWFACKWDATADQSV